jgi:hypothetical protein
MICILSAGFYTLPMRTRLPFRYGIVTLREIEHCCESLPRLLLSFGASLVERALIDAYCRAKGETFAQAVRSNSLGIRLDAFHPDLYGREPRELLPTRPLRRITARHAVGLIDPLTDPSAASPPTAEGSVELQDDNPPRTLEAYTPMTMRG